MKQKSIFIAVVALLILVFAGGVYMFNQQKTAQAERVLAQNRQLLVRADAPRVGNPNAPVQIVEFFDPACGTCREFYPLVKKMMAENQGKILLSMRYAPLHPGSDQVVKALEAARRQGMFWQALETLFVSQDQWVQNHRASPDQALSQLARMGLDMGQLQQDMNSPEVARVIEQDIADGKALNVSATPEY
ncbi:MAG: thioredoxin domain-containing protein, partial [Ramlibacter sp.]